MRRFIRFILLAALVSDCNSQDAAFSSDVKVVSLLATVRDASGAVVGNLTKDHKRSGIFHGNRTFL
jgi:hypothetical protein